MSWGWLIEQHLDELGSRRYADGTLKLRRAALQRFIVYASAQGIRHPSDVTSQLAQSYAFSLHLQRNRYGQTFSMATVGPFIGHLRQFYGWAVRHAHLFGNPFAELQFERVQPRRLIFPGVADIERLMAQPPVTPAGLRDRAIIEVLYGTGLRRRECWALDLADVDLVAGMLYVRQGKGGEARVQPLGEHLVLVLERWLRVGRPHLLKNWPQSQPAFFVGRGGGRVHYERIGQIVKDYGRRAGIEGLNPHVLRRAFAIHLIAGGADVRDVKELLGHHRLQTTTFYTQIEPDELAREHRRTHPRA